MLIYLLINYLDKVKTTPWVVEVYEKGKGAGMT